MEIVEMLPIHWDHVKKIYEQGIATRNATLQGSAPSWEEWNKDHLENLRYVAVFDDTLTGWAALTPVSGRCVYAGVNEVSIYIHAEYRGKGFGAALLQKLISESEKQNIWTLQSGIFPENTASIRLHERLGFRTVGFREKIGKLEGTWRDVVLMERRSSVVGQD